MFIYLYFVLKQMLMKNTKKKERNEYNEKKNGKKLKIKNK